MGSYYETCFLSHLPIYEGEKVHLFFLEEVGGYDEGRKSAGFTTPTRMWSPCTFGLSGVYDDYGRIRDIDAYSFEARMALSHLRSKLIEMPAEDDAPAVTREGLDFSNAQEHMGEGRLRFTDYQGNPRQYGRVLLRDDIRRAILTKHTMNFTHTIKEGRAFSDLARSKVKDLLYVTSFDLELIQEPSYADGRMSLFKANLIHSSDVSHVRRLEIFSKLLKEDAVSNDMDRFIRLLAAQITLDGAIYELRRAWMPQCGRGSQANDDLYHAWFSERVAKIARARDAKLTRSWGA